MKGVRTEDAQCCSINICWLPNWEKKKKIEEESVSSKKIQQFGFEAWFIDS